MPPALSGIPDIQIGKTKASQLLGSRSNRGPNALLLASESFVLSLALLLYALCKYDFALPMIEDRSA